MNLKWRALLLKTIPYLLSIGGGLALFWLASNEVSNENLNDLIDNISASLLSIPLVFLLYDYSNYQVSRQVNRTIAQTVSDKINTDLINVVCLFRQMMGMRGKLTLNTWNTVQNMSATQVAHRLNIRPAHVQQLRVYHDSLYDVLYKGGRTTALSDAQIQILADIVRDIGRIINLHNAHLTRHDIAKYIAAIMERISDWQDMDDTISGRLQPGGTPQNNDDSQ